MAKQSEERVPARRRSLWDIDLFAPWRPLRERGSSLEKLLEEMWGEPSRLPGALLPAVDVSEDPKHYTVTVELPGVKKDDVSVEIQEGVLTIRGEKKSEREEKKEHRRWVERSFGSFARSFTLPPDADPDRVEASFGDGVLTLQIGKSEEAKPRQIAIKV